MKTTYVLYISSSSNHTAVHTVLAWKNLLVSGVHKSLSMKL